MLDFGIPKVLGHLAEPDADVHPDPSGADLTSGYTLRPRDGAIMGTMPYMAPEQWRADRIDTRTDIWAIGIMLWELCTGRHPLAPVSYERLPKVRGLHTPMPSLVESEPRVGPLAQIIDRCLHKRPAERMASAQALLDALEPLLPRRVAPTPFDAGELDNHARVAAASARTGGTPQQ